MNVGYKHTRIWRYYLAIIAVFIIAASIIYTNRLVNKLALSEKKSIELWAESLKQISNNQHQDLTLATKIIEQNTNIPVILVDENNHILQFLNIKIPSANKKEYLEKRLQKMMSGNNIPIEIDLQKGKNYVYYSDSVILKQIIQYPYIQLAVIFVFILLGYFTLTYAQSAEKNKLWVGLSKETAHQLGTPISSLLAWQELLKERNANIPMLMEIGKDITRLKNISERFSKIGSKPVLEPHNIKEILHHSLIYLKQRFSTKVKYSIKIPNYETNALLNPDLFGWVLENLCKNAVDAMSGIGKIIFFVSDTASHVYVDISDTGKGIPSKEFKAIFKPGYTTKKRGWGLGLSLAKRIIETYHKGRIFVKKSSIDKGSTFRIVLNKPNLKKPISNSKIYIKNKRVVLDW